jgi:hypothetical protein
VPEREREREREVLARPAATDQNAALAQPTPATSALEAVAGRWVLELLGLPSHFSFGFVTGCPTEVGHRATPRG